MSKSILVVGASGQIGSEIVRILKSQGHKIRTTSSRPQATSTKEGLETVYVNLVTGEGLTNAFNGIQRAFILSPGGYADQYSMVAPLIQEAKRRGLEKVVLMTAMGVDAAEGSPFRRAELELENSGLTYNIIRPNWFMQNFNTFWVHGIKSEGKIMLPAGEAKTSFIDTRDIGEVAAHLLIDDTLKNQALDLTGPQSLSHAEVAQVISKITGKKVVYQEIEPTVLKQGLMGAGLKEDYVNFMLVILDALKAGYNARTTSAVKSILGREPRSFEAYVQDLKASF